MVPDVIADATAQVLHKVIRADVVGATTAGGARSIEAGGADADPGQKVEASLLTQSRLEKQVEIGKDGSEVFLASDINALTSPPGGFDIKPEAIVEDHIASEVEVKAAFFRREGASGSCGRQQRAAADKNVALLRAGEVARKNESENGCKKR